MQDKKNIIHILPEAVANQIAAGEVVQRPSSVIKELMENAIDAGATKIDVIIKEGGKGLIQVVDNGKGISPKDASLAFERHATSKIKKAEDLFHLQSMGFRGEALASIAAVAQVEMRSRQKSAEIGISIKISGSEITSQEEIACPIGTNMMIKNLFFNIPARRKFLKSIDAEYRYILTVFQQIVLVYPQIEFSLRNNGNDIIHLHTENKHQRIVSLFGAKINSNLLSININTTLVKASGFISTPEAAQKRGTRQYFFINGRYIQYPYLYKAISSAYEKLLPSNMKPHFFIYFEIDPKDIDVNIHPAKTEVKFANERDIFPILSAAIRECLGRSNATPSINFDMENAPSIPIAKKDTNLNPPTVSYDPQYSPFQKESYQSKKPTDNWETLYENTKNTTSNEPNKANYTQKTKEFAPELNIETNQETPTFQFNNKYIVQQRKDSIVFTHQYRAHVRVLFEDIMKSMNSEHNFSQQLLFPALLELNHEENSQLNEIRKELKNIGYEIEDFGENTYQLSGIPAMLGNENPIDTLKEAISLVEKKENITQDRQSSIALRLAKKTAIKTGKKLQQEECNNLLKQLYNCKDIIYTPEGKKISFILTDDEIDKKIK